LRELRGDDRASLRELRLHALRTEPGVFHNSYANEADYSDDDWTALATGDETHQVFGIFDDDQLVGISAVFTDRDDPTGRTAVLAMSYILPEYRRRGFVSRFYEARLAWVRARPQFQRVAVGHRRSNVASSRAIARFGFVWTNDEPRRWPDGGEENYARYELRLRDDA